MAPKQPAGPKKDNKRALIFLAVGGALLLIAYLGTHVLSGSGSGKSASATIRASISTATTLPVHAKSGVTLRPRVVTAPGPTPNTTRNPFAHS
jgi:hypothetical protein